MFHSSILLPAVMPLNFPTLSSPWTVHSEQAVHERSRPLTTELQQPELASAHYVADAGTLQQMCPGAAAELPQSGSRTHLAAHVLEQYIDAVRS